MLNEAKWLELDMVSVVSGHKYFGRFLMKPYLTLSERADASRLANQYTRGLDPKNEIDRPLWASLRFAAFLKYHILDTDADWWPKDDPSKIYDEDLAYQLINLVRPEEKEEPEVKEGGV